MFFKRLSRSRSNSQSYIDNYSPHDSKAPSASFDDKFRDEQPYDAHPDSARVLNPATRDSSIFATPNQNPLSSPSFDQYASPPLSSSGNRPMNGYGPLPSGSNPAMTKAPLGPAEPMPDLLTRAFNEAVRPYTLKLEEMENEIADMRSYIDQMEAQRREVHAWIDKRGLRPGNTTKRPCKHTRIMSC